MTRRPNLLLINVDQLRYDCLGYAGVCPVRTPAIDRLAAGGVLFEHAYTPVPSCCPARQAFLTGRSAESLGAHWNYDISLPIASIGSEVWTWTTELQKAGYRTALVGKWHVSRTHGPTDFGYEDYYGVETYTAGFPDYVEKVTDITTEFWGKPSSTPLESSRTHVLAGEAVARIEKYAETDRPWHVRLDFPEPHLPYRPSGRFASMYAPDDAMRWPSFDDRFEGKPFIQRQQLLNWDLESKSWDDWKATVASYYAVVSQIDDAIGMVLDALDTTAQTEETMVIFTSDHGDLCGAHRMVDKHYVMYDDVVRVPLVVRLPGVVMPNQRTEVPTCHYLDLVPTLLEMLDLPRPPEVNLHGRSLTRILRGESDTDRPDYVVSSYNGAQFGLYNERMIRTKSLKYVWNLTDIDELYDLDRDPHELDNVVARPEYEAKLADLRRTLLTELRRREDPLVGNKWLQPQLLEGRKMSTRPR